MRQPVAYRGVGIVGAIATDIHLVSIGRWSSDAKISVEIQLTVGRKRAIQSKHFLDDGRGHPQIYARHWCQPYRANKPTYFCGSVVVNCLVAIHVEIKKKKKQQLKIGPEIRKALNFTLK